MMSDVMGRWKRAATAWEPPAEWLAVDTIDAHTAGEPLRIVVAGLPPIEGRTVLEYRRFTRQHLDLFRTVLMWEPRGHRDMYGCVILPPTSEDADFAVLFLHNEGYSSMCGHGIIAVTTAAIEIGLIEPVEPETIVKIDSPAGRIVSRARIENQSVTEVSFENVPSFVVALDQTVSVEGLGNVRYDLAFGGAYYAYVSASNLSLELRAENATELIACGRAIKRAVAATQAIQHPTHTDLSFLYGTIFTGPAHTSANHSRNVCVFADGQVDRSPTGTGVSGRVAIEFARNRLDVGTAIKIESILGTVFSVEIAGQTDISTTTAVIPKVTGQAFLTGKSRFFVDPNDPLGHGFLLQ